MRPLTHSTAKQLLPIANKPILHRAIEQMATIGIKEVAIVVGFTAEQVKDSVGDGSQFGVNISYLQQDQPLGLAHCVKIARNFLANEDFVMFLGDNMFEFGLDELISSFRHRQSNTSISAQVAVKKVSNPSSFGVAVTNGSGDLISVEEKPLHPKSDLALVGTYYFTPQIHEAIDAISPSPRGELEITDAIQELISREQVVGVTEVDGWWFDTGNPDSFLECNAKTLDSLVLENISRSPDVTIYNPCAVDPSAVLSNCTIGPHVSIGAGVIVTGVNIQNSVLLESSSVVGSGSVQDSILGKRSSVTIEGESILKIILGDDCVAEVASK